MGDFEDIFGAGADFEAIIDNIDRRNNEDDEDQEDEGYPSGQNVPRASSFYELTCSFGSLSADVFRTLDRSKHELFEKEAQMLASALPCPEDGDFEGSWRKFAEEFSRIFVSVTDRCCETLSELEAFLVMVTCSLPHEIEAVLVRDTSHHNGMLGPGLSTHAIVLPEGFFLARIGKFKMQGPFWFLDTSETHRAVPCCSLAAGLPGQEVLAISQGASDAGCLSPEKAIRRYREDARAWVVAHRECGCEEGKWLGNRTIFNLIAQRAEDFDGRAVRTWSDRQEQNLRDLIQRLSAAILPVQAVSEIHLYAEATRAKIDAKYYDDRISMPRHDAFNAALKTLIDLSPFRGRRITRRGRRLGLSITLLDGKSDAKSVEDQLAGREVLLDLAEQRRLDRAAVQAAIAREDWRQLADLLYLNYVDPCAIPNSPEPHARVGRKHSRSSRERKMQEYQEQVMKDRTWDDLPSYLKE